MSIELLGTYAGVPVYLSDGPASSAEMETLPTGYFACGLAFQEPDLDALALGRRLTLLYGRPDLRERFRRERGARMFAFFGDAAELAHDICDSYAFAWLGGAASDGDVIMTTWESQSTEEFAIALFAIALAEGYGDRAFFLIESYGDSDWLRNVRAGLESVLPS